MHPLTFLPQNFNQGDAGKNALVTMRDFIRFAATLGIGVTVVPENNESEGKLNSENKSAETSKRNTILTLPSALKEQAIIKKFTMRKWLTTAESALQLSAKFDEQITEADVLRFALDGHLSLSLKLSNFSHACRVGEIKTPAEINPACPLEYKFNEDEVLQVSTVVQEISEIFTIAMVGYGRYRIQEEYSATADTAPLGETDLLDALDDECGVILMNKDDVWQLVERNGLWERLQGNDVADIPPEIRQRIVSPWDAIGYRPSMDFPVDGFLMVQTEALREFEESQYAKQKEISTERVNTSAAVNPQQFHDEVRSRAASKAANTLHDKPGGSRSKHKQIQAIWATNKYSSRDVCAEQECASLEMSFSAARNALKNTPDPT